MRILIASYARGAVGGVETYLRGVAPALMARGHELALIFEQRLESGGDPTLDPYRGRSGEWCVAECGLEAAVAGAKAWGPELVWIHGLQDGELEGALLELGPAMLFAHNYDGTCATGSKWHAWPQPRPCARVLGAACIPLNFARQCGMRHPAGFARSLRRQQQRSGRLGRYRRILVASRHMAAEFERHLAAQGRTGRSGEAPAVRRLPYPLLEARAEAPRPRSGAPRQVLMLARLTAAKGGEYLLRALAAAERPLGRRLQVTIAGEGPERARLEARAQALQLEAEFPGWISAEERRRRLSRADLLAVPSLWPEPFGMVGIEAAAQGVPAVGYAVGGIPDWLRAGESGELAPGSPPSVEGLTAAVVRALEEPAHWERLRQGAWTTAAEYGLEEYLDRLEAEFAASCPLPAVDRKDGRGLQRGNAARPASNDGRGPQRGGAARPASAEPL